MGTQDASWGESGELAPTASSPAPSEGYPSPCAPSSRASSPSSPTAATGSKRAAGWAWALRSTVRQGRPTGPLLLHGTRHGQRLILVLAVEPGPPSTPCGRNGTRVGTPPTSRAEVCIDVPRDTSAPGAGISPSRPLPHRRFPPADAPHSRVSDMEVINQDQTLTIQRPGRPDGHDERQRHNPSLSHIHSLRQPCATAPAPWT